MPVLFGGPVAAESLLLTEFVGTRTSGLNGLIVTRRSGLGGRAMDQLRPASVADYRNAESITHHYDAPVLGEQIRSVLAVPVVVDGRARAVLYAADSSADPIGGRTVDSLIGAGRRLAVEFAIRDEVDRRLRMQAALAQAPSDPVQTETLRDIHAELRTLQLHDLADRLAQAISGTTPDPDVTLAPRELDVLSQVALGCTNQQAAQRLSIGQETVKGYLRSTMAKLGVNSRAAAVVAARRSGLLP